jgi:Tfp pilus assembly protein FimV
MSTQLLTPRHTSYAVRVPRNIAAPIPTSATYRRRRLGASVFVAALLATFVLWAAPSSAEPVGVGSTGQTSTYTVQPGDTLWAIAQRLYPSSDVTLVVDAMVSLNGSATILAGQQLRLP